MNEKEYIKVGELKIVDDEVFVKRDYHTDGLAYGYIFKDEEAYEKDWDAICYVPEHSFDGLTPDNEGFYSGIDGYSHNDLLLMCNGNREWCDAFFQDLIWAYPDTYEQEQSDQDVAYYYRFIKPGAKVWWRDPAGETSGEYTVFGVPFEFDERGELIDPDDFALDTIVMIGNDYSEAEVTPNELTPVYPDLIQKEK